MPLQLDRQASSTSNASISSSTDGASYPHSTTSNSSSRSGNNNTTTTTRRRTSTGKKFGNKLKNKVKGKFIKRNRSSSSIKSMDSIASESFDNVSICSSDHAVNSKAIDGEVNNNVNVNDLSLIQEVAAESISRHASPIKKRLPLSISDKRPSNHNMQGLTQIRSPPSSFQGNNSTPLSPPTTISGTDAMGLFSKVTGPSPIKLTGGTNTRNMNLDISMDYSTHMDDNGNDDGDKNSSVEGTRIINNKMVLHAAKLLIKSEKEEKLQQPVTLFRRGMISNDALLSPRDTTTRLSLKIPKQSYQENNDRPVTTVSASDCMSQFSSIKSPSPMKMNHDDSIFNVSMNTTIDVADSVLDDDGGLVDQNGKAQEASSKASPGSTQQSSSRPRQSPRQSQNEGGKTKQKKVTHPSTIRSSRTSRRQTKPSAKAADQQEYNVDHSCSTPLERLARDIGNTLRSWNVHQGCDVHVPLDWGERMENVELGQEEQEESDTQSPKSPKQTYGEIEVQTPGDISMLSPGGVSMLSPGGVSMLSTSPSIMDNESVGTNNCMSMDQCERGFANRSRKFHSWLGKDESSPSNIISKSKSSPQPPQSRSPFKKDRGLSFTPPRSPLKTSKHYRVPTTPSSSTGIKQLLATKKVARERCHNGARCIRSKKIIFQTTGYSPQHDDDDSECTVSWNRRRYTIPLVLKLWDAPCFPTELPPTSSDSEESDDNLPRSLKPDISPSTYSLLGEFGFLSSSGSGRTFYEKDLSSAYNAGLTPQTGLTQDFSTLFNIGQHITLCLDESKTLQNNTDKDSDVENLFNDIHAYIENHIHDAVEAQRLALRERQAQCKKRQRQLLKQKQTKTRHEAKQKTQPHFGETEGHRDDIVGMSLQSQSWEEDDQIVFDNDSYDDEHVANNSDSDDSDESDSDGNGSILSNQGVYFNQQEIHAEVTSSLTSTLQTALNLAATENDCSMPVFGLWGDYNGDISSKHDNGNKGLMLPWIPTGQEDNLSQSSDSYDDPFPEEEENTRKFVLSSPILSGSCQSSTGSSFRSTHRVYSIPDQVLPFHLSTLNGLANVLLGQCPNKVASVVLSAARHCYHWKQHERISQHWRLPIPSTDPSAVEMYQEKCRQQAIVILERASSPWVYRTLPMWGPSEGTPLLSLAASISWGVIPSTEGDSAADELPPLLQLPLKIRSSNFASTPSELLDLEYALQSAALNPIGIGIVEREDGQHDFGPREPIFFASAEFDMDAPCATLSANTRCVLAALLRCGSLGLDVLPGHLTKKEILSKLGRQERVQMAGESSSGEDTTADPEKILRKAIELAKVGPVTRRLIEALDWGEIDMDLSAADFDRATAEALQRIQSTAYPTPPVEVFSIGDMSNKMPAGNRLYSQSKGSPPGRLLSVLFAHMARLRTPPSMMRLWLSFVEILRTRYDVNESLPNLGFVPGLDNVGDNQHDHSHWGLHKADNRVLGHRADHAAFVNSSEPDPDRDHCIINQKLQVYNICIECKMSTEALHEKQMEQDHDASVDSVGSTKNSSDDDEFFEAEEEEIQIDESPQKRRIEEMLMLHSAVMNPHHNRVGARCPVPDGMPLIESGDQLYAPYLQRTMPMTDEEEQKQKKFLGVTKTPAKAERPSIKSRISIAQRLQKPKLLSDMSSFKAANHDAVFEDFVSWYGNPENPLSEEVNGETARLALEYRSTLSPEDAKTLALEEASEAIAILMSLRAFWEDTWEEAESCPAFEQEPLFDPYSTVEMLLHSFETIHPALLMNQVLVVKLSNVKFVLESAAHPARKVVSVATVLLNLKKAIDEALESLTKDAADGFLLLSPNAMTDSDPLVYVSTSTIRKCEEACNIIGEVEILLSRALSLLQKFPQEYDLVETLLQSKSGQYLMMKHPRERTAFLAAIKRHQRRSSASPEATPVTREYVLRNTDSTNPCQLSARLVANLDETQSASQSHGSLLLALTKSSRT